MYFGVSLPGQPTSNVTVTISPQSGSANPDIHLVNTTLTFTPDNWNVPQYVYLYTSSGANTTNVSKNYVVSATGYISKTVTVSEVEYIQGVKALGNQFLVNTYLTNPQTDPSIGMDDNGDFVISWSTFGQDLSYFQNIKAQRHDRDGNRVGAEFMVNQDVTVGEGESYVSMSHDGAYFLITWTESGILAKLYNNSGAVVRNQFSVSTGSNSCSAWDYGNNYLIAFEHADTTIITQEDNTGVYGIEYNVAGTTLRSLFRFSCADMSNASNFQTPTSTPLWPYFQGNPQVVIDADGDMAAVYDGFSPDNSGNPPTDIQYEINSLLWAAVKSGYTNAQLAALRLQTLQSNYDSLSDYQGIMVAPIDASTSNTGNNSADTQVNTTLDGNNQTDVLALDSRATTGDFTLRITNSETSQRTDVRITPVYQRDDGPINAQQTLTAIQNALNGLGTIIGSGSVVVREVDADEISARSGTDWDLLNFLDTTTNRVVYEILYYNFAHNISFDLSLSPGGNNLSRKSGDTEVAADDPEMATEIDAYYGTTQEYAYIGMSRNGSFVIAWTQENVASDQSTSTTSQICYQTYTENMDTAGPIVTDFILTDGTRLGNNTQVNTSASYLIVTFDEAMTGQRHARSDQRQQLGIDQRWSVGQQRNI